MLFRSLFEPLGIGQPEWDASAQGISYGGFGLHLRTGDIARFGQLLLQKGEWQGRRLVPADWIEAATARQTANGSNPDSDWEQGYGYQFWRCRHGFFRGDGAHGQFCIVMPQYDTVVAITSGTNNMGSVMQALWDHLLPELRPAPLPEDPAGQAVLTARLAALTLPTPQGAATAPVAAAIEGRRFLVAANDLKLEAFKLATDAAGQLVFTVWIGGEEAALRCGRGTWVQNTFPGPPAMPMPTPTAAAAAWTSDDTFTLKFYHSLTPFGATVRIRFAGDNATLEVVPNPGKALPPLEAHAAPR